MKIKIAIFFIYLAFAGYILWGEIELNGYGTAQGALNRIDADERAELAAFRRGELAERRAQTENFIAPRLKTIEDMDARNRERIARGEPLSHVKSKDVEVAKIDSARAADELWRMSRENSITQKYAEQRLRVDSSSMISLTYVMPCLALFLALFSSWVTSPRFQFIKQYGFPASFVAQGVSCIITFNAIWIQQGSWFRALAFSVGAFFCIPIGHVLAGDLWDALQGAKKDDQCRPENTTRKPHRSNIVLTENGNGRVVARKIKDSLPMPDNLEDGKTYLRLIILNDEYADGDNRRIADKIGVDWKKALRRTFDKAWKDHEGTDALSFDAQMHEVERLEKLLRNSLALKVKEG